MEYKLNDMEMKEKYRLLTNCIVPRTIAELERLDWRKAEVNN